MDWFTAICTPIGNAETLAQVGAEVGANVQSHQATSGNVQREPSQVTPCRAIPGCVRRLVELIWEQEAAGLNPAIPTSFQICCR